MAREIFNQIFYLTAQDNENGCEVLQAILKGLNLIKIGCVCEVDPEGGRTKNIRPITCDPPRRVGELERNLF